MRSQALRFACDYATMFNAFAMSDTSIPNTVITNKVLIGEG